MTQTWLPGVKRKTGRPKDTTRTDQEKHAANQAAWRRRLRASGHVRLTVNLTGEVRDRLRVLAKDRKTTMSRLIEQAVIQWLG